MFNTVHIRQNSFTHMCAQCNKYYAIATFVYQPEVLLYDRHLLFEPLFLLDRAVTGDAATTGAVTRAAAVPARAQRTDLLSDAAHRARADRLAFRRQRQLRRDAVGLAVTWCRR